MFYIYDKRDGRVLDTCEKEYDLTAYGAIPVGLYASNASGPRIKFLKKHPVGFCVRTWKEERQQFLGGDGIWFFGAKSEGSLGYISKKMHEAMCAAGILTQFSCQGVDGVVPDVAIKLLRMCRESIDRQPCKTEFGYYMNDSTRCPRWLVRRMNETDGVFTPSRFSKTALEDSGVSVPIWMWPHGVDPQEFYPVERDWDAKPYRFLYVGNASRRKGTDLLLESFQEAFEGVRADEVQLVLRTPHSDILEPFLGDSRIEHLPDWYGDLMSLYASCHCLVFPSRCEAFGLPPIEAAATGMRVIATEWGGMLDYLDDIGAEKIPVAKEIEDEMREFESDEKHGIWGEPDKGHLIELLRGKGNPVKYCGEWNIPEVLSEIA